MKHQATPYLSFNGNAREALEFYKEVFEGEILGIQTYGDADYPSPPEMDDKIMHAQFKKDQLFLMASDTFSGDSVEIGNNISLVLEFDNEEDIQKIYNRLIVNSSILMELQDTFWGAKFARVKDSFGVIWDLNHTKAKQ